MGVSKEAITMSYLVTLSYHPLITQVVKIGLISLRCNQQFHVFSAYSEGYSIW